MPRHTFSAVFGAVIARGLDYQETFRVFRPDFDLTLELERRAAAGQPESFAEEDLYPDARGCLESLKDQGLFVGLAGNQPAHAEATLRALDLPVDVIGTSHGWAVAKPSPAFFERVVAAGGGVASSILYVGDRPDNDVRPALEAGMQDVPDPTRSVGAHPRSLRSGRSVPVPDRLAGRTPEPGGEAQRGRRLTRRPR